MRINFSTNSLRTSPAFFNFSITVAIKTGSFSVALSGLPVKLSKLNNIGLLTGVFHVTSLSMLNALNCYSPNFGILEISSNTVPLKVVFSLLSTANLFSLNGFVMMFLMKKHVPRTNFEKLCCLQGALWLRYSAHMLSQSPSIKILCLTFEKQNHH